jgi:hypothetical protein
MPLMSPSWIPVGGNHTWEGTSSEQRIRGRVSWWIAEQTPANARWCSQNSYSSRQHPFVACSRQYPFVACVVHMYTYVCACMHIRMYACMHACMHACIHTYVVVIYIYTCTHRSLHNLSCQFRCTGGMITDSSLVDI